MPRPEIPRGYIEDDPSQPITVAIPEGCVVVKPLTTFKPTSQEKQILKTRKKRTRKRRNSRLEIKPVRGFGLCEVCKKRPCYGVDPEFPTLCLECIRILDASYEEFSGEKSPHPRNHLEDYQKYRNGKMQVEEFLHQFDFVPINGSRPMPLIRSGLKPSCHPGGGDNMHH